ncbi:MAG TPA: glycosyltransferase family 2 protein [Motilibacterales bacterium]|nr:glycosyltransferase family 2 protein [Motilibacterales bacterium]
MPGRAAVLAATALAAGLTAHTAWNTRHLRPAPVPAPGDPAERVRVTVLLPARDEAHRIEPCLVALLAQDHRELRVLILDDGSTDGTGALVRAAVSGDPRFEVVDGGHDDPPPGWLGKPWACQRLAEAALGDDPAPDLLLFVDADVVLAPDAVHRIAGLVRDSGLDLVSPYPRQIASTIAERLVQPLLQWSWLTTLPLGLAEGSPRPSLTAANGQVLAITPEAHRRSGGHTAVRHEVLEDIALARAVKATGGRANVTDGTDLASCRMYTSRAELVDGYTKSLWAAFGSPIGSAGVTGMLTFAYVLPPIAALLAPTPGTRALGAAGYAAGVAGRVLVARRTGGRAADSWSHPLSILALDGLTALSWWRHEHDQLAWKGRRVHVQRSSVQRSSF